MIPGSNLLRTALSVIAKQSVSYYRFLDTITNAAGLKVSTYQDPVTLLGSLQPVSRNLYEQYGLDLQKTYYTFYASADILDVVRDISGDKLVFGGKEYSCVSANDWYAVDGWTGILVILKGNVVNA